MSDPRVIHKWSHKKQNQDKRNIYVIMKTMRPPDYYHNGFVATHALGHMMWPNAWVATKSLWWCADNQEGTLFSWKISYAKYYLMQHTNHIKKKIAYGYHVFVSAA